MLTKATFASQAKGDPQAKNASALRFGILGAARIGPTAFIEPARTHPDVIVAAVACRDKERGQQYAQKHGIPKTFSGSNAYHGKSVNICIERAALLTQHTGTAELVTNPDIDAVYIAVRQPHCSLT